MKALQLTACSGRLIKSTVVLTQKRSDRAQDLLPGEHNPNLAQRLIKTCVLHLNCMSACKGGVLRKPLSGVHMMLGIHGWVLSWEAGEMKNVLFGLQRIVSATHAMMMLILMSRLGIGLNV